jgi:bifunctional non-homologous end joining protein LigD
MSENNNPLPAATLWNHEAGHDKIYKLSVVADGDGYAVRFAYGRRGAALTVGVKTRAPVALAEAEALFNKLLREKLAGGYQPIMDTPEVAAPAGAAPKKTTAPAVPVASADRERAPAATGRPQLLNPIDEDTANHLMENSNVIMQEKFDGVRLTVSVAWDGTVSGGNKLGLDCPVPKHLAGFLSRFPLCNFDGELVGAVYHIFDLLQYNGRTLTKAGLSHRLILLDKLPLTGPGRLVRSASTIISKLLLFDLVRRKGGEGVVFKRIDAPYQPGRPSGLGDWLKFKFVHDATCRVSGVNQRRSVALTVRDAFGCWQPVGNVSVPANQPIPAVGDFVEVRYLYAYRGGCLAQPVLKGIRRDCVERDCATSQLFYKPEPAAVA